MNNNNNNNVNARVAIGIWFLCISRLLSARAQSCGSCHRGFVPIGSPEWCCFCQLGCFDPAGCAGFYCVQYCTQFVGFCPSPAPLAIVPTAAPMLPLPPITTRDDVQTVPIDTTITTLHPTPMPTPVPMPPLTLPTGLSLGTTKINDNSASPGVGVATDATAAADVDGTNTSNDVRGGAMRGGVDALTIGAAVGGVSAGLALLIVAFIAFKVARRRQVVGPVEDGIVTNDVDVVAHSRGGTEQFHSARSERSSMSPPPGSYGIVPRNDPQVFQYDQCHYGDGNLQPN